MTVASAIVPLLKGEAAESIKRTISSAKIKSYTKEERDKTLNEVALVLKSKRRAST